MGRKLNTRDAENQKEKSENCKEVQGNWGALEIFVLFSNDSGFDIRVTSKGCSWGFVEFPYGLPPYQGLLQG